MNGKARRRTTRRKRIRFISMSLYASSIVRVCPELVTSSEWMDGHI
jgi:hypothetical protein